MTKVKVKPLFTEVEKCIAAYQKEVAKLDNQELQLKTEMAVIEEEMTANILSQENADMSERIYLRGEAKEIVTKSEVINVLLEELKQSRTDLKLKYVPLLRKALSKVPVSEYEVTEIVERYKYQMLKEISEIGNQVRSQYFEIAPDIEEIFHDKDVLEQFPRLKYTSYDTYKPQFNWFNNSVVSKSEVSIARDGNLPQGLKQPKEKDVE